MSKEIVVNVEDSRTRIAIVEDGKLAELYIENAENKRTIGNMYLGRIRKVMPSIQAAFVDIGQEQDAFLHFSDLSDNLGALVDFLGQDKPRVETVDLPEEEGKRPDLRRGQEILVQVTKEPISNKGSRISTDLSLAGRFLVLVPLQRYVAVSRKITEEKERRRLKALASSLVPEGFGVIVRTVAEGRDAKSLDKDLKLLMERWRRAEEKLDSVEPPALVHEDVDMASSIIRDQFSDDYDRILVDHKPLFHSIRSYVRAVAPKMVDRVELHDKTDPVFEAANIQRGADRAFKDRVELPSGGYLFIERTEAMHVIDVNSGRSGRGKSQSQNSLDVNLEAARVIVRQIRLRDLGGIIVVDFIDLRDEKDRKKVYDEIKKGFKDDRAVTKVLPMSDFGLVEITRQRLRPSLTTTFSSANGESSEEDRDSSSGSGNGNVQRIERKLERTEMKLEESRRQLNQKESEIEKLREKADEGGSGPDPSELQSLRDKLKHYQREAREARKRAKKAESDARKATEKAETSTNRAPAASGDGVAVDPEQVVRSIEEWVEAHRSDRRAVTLHVHPFTAAFLHRPVPSYQTEWFMKYYVRVHIESDPTMSPLDYRFVDTRSGAVLEEA
ncbi:ribonuclease G [Longibacter salinarum]|uniref:Ribonuclease G n=1 Tax=Longibacter salinarum TaxID=1850348 RepID=A0A2A8CUB5_9BACT|nr:Rne/Rng family ribonuclease [Longibacter salinarum]PEN11353.1 ribonuclease G [Longibacter salinarum]